MYSFSTSFCLRLLCLVPQYIGLKYNSFALSTSYSVPLKKQKVCGKFAIYIVCKRLTSIRGYQSQTFFNIAAKFLSSKRIYENISASSLEANAFCGRKLYSNITLAYRECKLKGWFARTIYRNHCRDYQIHVLRTFRHDQRIHRKITTNKVAEFNTTIVSLWRTEPLLPLMAIK